MNGTQWMPVDRPVNSKLYRRLLVYVFRIMGRFFKFTHRIKNNDNEGIILISNSRKSVWDVVCIDLAQDRDRWKALVKVAMELPVL
jgi:hypothetical protein